jgi:phage tail P2-like protein
VAVTITQWDQGGGFDAGLRWDSQVRERLLPTHCAPQELTLEDATARIGRVPVQLRLLWRPRDCPTALLPWLAWTLSVDEWDPAWSEATKRNMLAESALLHARKGTPWAVKRALQLIGYGNVEILEGSTYRRDGTYARGGAINHGGDIGPYEFDVVLNVGGAPSAAQQAEIRRRVGYYKNARSHLRRIVAYGVFHDGAHDYDGSITYAGGFAAEE